MTGDCHVRIRGSRGLRCPRPPDPGEKQRPRSYKPPGQTVKTADSARTMSGALSSRSPFSPRIRPKTPHGFISHQSRGDEPRKHESAGQRADAAPRPTAMSGPLVAGPAAFPPDHPPDRVAAAWLWILAAIRNPRRLGRSKPPARAKTEQRYRASQPTAPRSQGPANLSLWSCYSLTLQ
jgi:hypothetical protein